MNISITRKMPNGIMDWFFKKVNQKVNLGPWPMPDTRPPILKDAVFEKKKRSKNQFWLNKLLASGEIST